MRTQKVEVTIRNDIQQIEEALFVYLTALDNAELAKQVLNEARPAFLPGRSPMPTTKMPPDWLPRPISDACKPNTVI